jgi:hypothetical protein
VPGPRCASYSFGASEVSVFHDSRENYLPKSGKHETLVIPEPGTTKLKDQIRTEGQAVVRPLVEITGGAWRGRLFRQRRERQLSKSRKHETLQTRNPEINCAQEANPIVYPAAELLTTRYRSSHERL